MRGSADFATEGAKRTSSVLPAFIIGLPSSYRGEPLERQLSSQGIRWTRIDGVLFRDDSTDASRVDKQAAKVLLHRDIRPGEVGCALAHRQAYRAIVQRGDPIAMVFEDDARLTGDIARKTIQELLETQVPRVLVLFHHKETAITYCNPRDGHLEKTEILRAIVPPTGTVAYALNLAAARLLLDEECPISHVADWPVRPSVHIQYYFLSQAVASPDPRSNSAIGDRSAFVRRGGLAPSAARMKRRFLAISHVTWFKYSKCYGCYRAYILHEFVRRQAFLCAIKNTARASEGHRGVAESGRILNLVGQLWR